MFAVALIAVAGLAYLHCRSVRQQQHGMTVQQRLAASLASTPTGAASGSQTSDDMLLVGERTTPLQPVTVPAATPVSPTQTRTQALAAAKADDKLYNDFQALVKRAQLRSGPTQQQQWDALLSANEKGIVPDASYTPNVLLSTMGAELSASNLWNTIAVGRAGGNLFGTGSRAALE